jgi:hypothetical protein
LDKDGVMLILFLHPLRILSYLSSIFESPIRINKTITSILKGSFCWIVYALFQDGNQSEISEQLLVHFEEIA